MSKFIKVTEVGTYKSLMINSREIKVLYSSSEGVVIEIYDESEIVVEESLEQIETQLLRDEFAMRALSGLLSNSGGVVQADPMNGTGYVSGDSARAAEWAYRLAGAMLKERSK